MFKNKKFILISVLTLILLILSINSCFASVGYYNSSGEFVELPELPVLENTAKMSNYIIVVNDPAGEQYYTLYYFPDEENLCGYEWTSTNHTLRIGYIDSDTSYECTSYRLNYSISDDWLSNGTSWGGPNLDGSYVVASTKDIINRDTNEVVFQRAPLFQQTVGETQAVVANQLEGVQMVQVMKEIVGVLPLIIVVVVSLVGLRKALQMLSTLLHKA